MGKKEEPPITKAIDFDLNYFRMLFNESDRGCALLTVARLDELLEELHKAHIQSKSSPEQKFIKELFAVHAPLSTLSAKIKLAFGYGFISKDDYKDLEILRGLRNGAAHTVDEFSFLDSELRKKIISISAPKRVPQQISVFSLTEHDSAAIANPNEDEASTKLYFLIAGMCLSFVLGEEILKLRRKEWNLLKESVIKNAGKQSQSKSP